MWSSTLVMTPNWDDLAIIAMHGSTECIYRKHGIAIYRSPEAKPCYRVPRRLYLAAYDEMMIGMVELDPPRRRWLGLEVTYSFVRPSWRGRGIGRLLYETILRDGVILVSGESQTPKSRAVWNYLAQNDAYTVWAMDPRRPERAAPIDYDAEKRQLVVPERIMQKRDWRLVAVKAEKMGHQAIHDVPKVA